MSSGSGMIIKICGGMRDPPEISLAVEQDRSVGCKFRLAVRRIQYSGRGVTVAICEIRYIASRGIIITRRRIVIGWRILKVFSQILTFRKQFAFEHRDVCVDHAEDVEFTAAGERKV